MPVLVDTSVWIDFFNGVPGPEVDLLDLLLGRREIVLGDLILAEILRGLARDRDFEATRFALRPFPIRDLVGPAIALQSAKNHRALRRLGISVRKTIDCLIATHCIETETPLLHRDRDFDPFEAHLGLQVVRSLGAA